MSAGDSVSPFILQVNLDLIVTHCAVACLMCNWCMYSCMYVQSNLFTTTPLVPLKCAVITKLLL